MTSVLVARSTFEEVAQQVEHERWKVKLPDRWAKIVIESPTIAALDPENGDFEAFQRRKNNEQFKRAEMVKVAHETGVPEELLRALHEEPKHTQLDSTALDRQHARAFELGLDEETMNVDIALRQEQNVQRVANHARRSLEAGHRMNPIHEFETRFYDLTDSSDEEDIPIYRPNTHTPHVNPQISFLDVANTALATIQTASEASRQTALATGQVAQLGANVVGTIGPPVIETALAIAPHAGRAIVGSARLTGHAARGSARLAIGSVRFTSQAARGVANAFSSLVQRGMPITHRGDDYLAREGINIVSGIGNFVAANRM